MKYLREARGTRKKPTLVCITIISKLNVHSPQEIATCAHRIGFDVFEFGSLGEIDRQHINESSIGGILPDPFFSKDGNVLACPFFSKYILGNLLEDTVDSIWCCEKLQHFRVLQSIEGCNYCALPIPRKCSLWRGLRGIFYNRIYAKLVTMV